MEGLKDEGRQVSVPPNPPHNQFEVAAALFSSSRDGGEEGCSREVSLGRTNVCP